MRDTPPPEDDCPGPPRRRGDRPGGGPSGRRPRTVPRGRDAERRPVGGYPHVGLRGVRAEPRPRAARLLLHRVRALEAPDGGAAEEAVRGGGAGTSTRDPAKTIQELRKGFCSDKRMTELDPIRLKYSAWARAFHASVKAFCERPTRESALAFFRTMGEADAKKCRCVVSDWRSTLARAGRPLGGELRGRPGCAASSNSSRWCRTT